MTEPNRVNFNSRKWQPGQEVRYHGSTETLPVRAGLFWYSGFGSGNYFSTDGTIKWLNSQEAAQQAKSEGVVLEFKDSFAYYSPTYVGD